MGSDMLTHVFLFQVATAPLSYQVLHGNALDWLSAARPAACLYPQYVLPRTIDIPATTPQALSSSKHMGCHRAQGAKLKFARLTQHEVQYVRGRTSSFSSQELDHFSAVHLRSSLAQVGLPQYDVTSIDTSSHRRRYYRILHTQPLLLA